MAGNFIETIDGAGRCRICDFFYSRERLEEVREHSAHHRRYLAACDGVGAPVNRFERAWMMEEGTELLAHGETLAERVRGAERQLASLFHDHLAAVLLGHVSRRLDFRDFVTRMDVIGTLDGRFEKNVADELRHLYSDRT
ncbi:MAG TPA: hypothetical protein VF794_28245 [Archangium sp.]|jgi:hypothetical protein|uniref:hypothetical protein n=1 Tax=Archangium sp. TaxID=1872627 RepID=UPI002EDA98AF